MKALKDAKTWTSDAKRQAKRKREEHRSQNETEAKKQHVAQPPAAPVAQQQLEAQVVVDSSNEQPVPIVEVKAETVEIKAEDGVAPQKPKAEVVPVSPNSSLMEKRGQTLPTQKQKKKESPIVDDPADLDAPTVVVNDEEANTVPPTTLEQSENEKDVKEEQEKQEQPMPSEESPELEPEQAALAAAAAAAAAASVEAEQGEKTEEQASQAVLQGLQLLTKAAAFNKKAAANASDASEKPQSVDV